MFFFNLKVQKLIKVKTLQFIKTLYKKNNINKNIILTRLLGELKAGWGVEIPKQSD